MNTGLYALMLLNCTSAKQMHKPLVGCPSLGFGPKIVGRAHRAIHLPLRRVLLAALFHLVDRAWVSPQALDPYLH